jgi:hypothetical protein
MFYTGFIYKNIEPYKALNLYLDEESTYANLISIKLIVKYLEQQNNEELSEVLNKYKYLEKILSIKNDLIRSYNEKLSKKLLNNKIQD